MAHHVERSSTSHSYSSLIFDIKRAIKREREKRKSLLVGNSTTTFATSYTREPYGGIGSVRPLMRLKHNNT